MKIPGNLLATVALGLALGAGISSCEKVEDAAVVHDINCPSDCDSEHKGDPEEEHNWENCPACGMG